jgi:hypothetical protein
MPYTEEDSLNVFLSFSSEDVGIASSIASTLRKAFPREVEITAMNEFPLGENWRELIDNSIDRTDVLIAIATGQLRPSHSFTGQEVGSFSFSMREKPKINGCDLDRRIIPFAVLASVPATVNEFEGITIDKDKLRDLRFDALSLQSQLNKEEASHNDDSSKMYLFLSDFEDILIKRRASIKKSSVVDVQRMRVTEERIKTLKELGNDLRLSILGLMLDREESSERPKAKLVVRLSGSAVNSPPEDWLTQSTIGLDGNVSEIFGPRANSALYTWEQLTGNIAEDIVYQWRKVFTALLSNSVKSIFLDDNSILSFDKKKIFRIFISQITHYYNGDRQIDIYIVEVLRQKDYGDPDSTLLLHGLEVSLAYRFMFLEKLSIFSPAYFKAVRIENFRESVSDMLDGLNVIILLTELYGLSNPQNILRILGLSAADSLAERYQYWDNERDAIYEAATRIIASKHVSELDKRNFIQSISDFCEHTKQMNESYTSTVMGVLNKTIESKQKTLISGDSGATK